MRPIKIEKKANGDIVIYVGVVDQSGNYTAITLSAAEAGALSVMLPNSL